MARGSVQQRSIRRAHSGRGHGYQPDGTADRPLLAQRLVFWSFSYAHSYSHLESGRRPPEPLLESSLAKERLLEDMIVAAPRLLSDEWMLVGRQEDTGFGGRVDLLAIAPDASLVLIELKRDRTPREVVAQAIDYAGWVEKLKPEDIAAIYGRFKARTQPCKRFSSTIWARPGRRKPESNPPNYYRCCLS